MTDKPPSEDNNSHNDRHRRVPPADMPTPEIAKAMEATIDTKYLPAGTRIGRFIILEKLASGGMSVVYKAYDPELARTIAMKAMTVSSNSEGHMVAMQNRMRREAQALARLSHPNVVSVYDVILTENTVFVAMEFIDGITLKEWLSTGVHDWRQILEVMITAGKAVASAHRNDLIHRDIKPGNIMLTSEGRVKVVDFGLARALNSEDSLEDLMDMGDMPEPAINEIDFSGETVEEIKAPPDNAGAGAGHPVEGGPSIRGSDSGSKGQASLLSSEITIAGSLLGTPEYMSPEQLRCEKVDHLSDQFSFCITLFEALYGFRPFRGKTVEELRDTVCKGELQSPPPDSDVPKWVLHVLKKGLSPDPNKRFRSMDELLYALQDDPLVKRKKYYKYGAIGTIALLLTFFSAYYGMTRMEPCSDAGNIADKLWNQDTRSKLQKSFTDVKVPNAREVFEKVSRALNSHILEWKKVRIETCRATNVTGEQSPVLMDLRMQCLDRKLEETRALIDIFTKNMDNKMLFEATEAVAKLSDISQCNNKVSLMAVEPPPSTQSTRSEISAVFKRLDRIKSLANSGMYEEAIKDAKKELKRAEEIAYKPLVATALDALGYAIIHGKKPAEGREFFEKALKQAASSNDHNILVSSALNLFYLLAVKLRSYESAETMSPMVESFLVIGKAAGKKKAEYLGTMGFLLMRRKKYDKALQKLDEAQRILENCVKVPQLQLAHILNLKGNLFMRRGEFGKALDVLKHVRAIYQEELGTDHPKMGLVMNNLGAVSMELGKLKDARNYIFRASKIYAKVLGNKHPKYGLALTNLGSILRRQGHYKEAVSNLQTALDILGQSYGKKHPFYAETLSELGESLIALGRFPRAIGVLERAVELKKESKADTCKLAELKYYLAIAYDHVQERKIHAHKIAKSALSDSLKDKCTINKKIEEWLASVGRTP